MRHLIRSKKEAVVGMAAGIGKGPTWPTGFGLVVLGFAIGVGISGVVMAIIGQ